MNARGDLGDARLLADAERSLLLAEQHIRLLDRVTPENLSRERQRLAEALTAGRRAEPRFEYRAVELRAVARGLEALMRELASEGNLARLFAERAEELLLEAELVESVGSRRFAGLARRRYPSEPSPALEALVEELAAGMVETDELIEVEAPHPQSLLNVVRRRIAEWKLPVRVELRTQLSCVAAAGDGFVAIRRGAHLSALAAERVAAHELLAHVMPRLQAAHEALGIYRVGTRGANEDEEGRALCIEQRLATWDSARRRELAFRHRAAERVHAGVELNDCVHELVRAGATFDHALDWSLRALRGGGLAREIVYLPAMLRFSHAIANDPSCERFFERGRVSLVAVPALRAFELSP
ncbi:MAG: tyrosine/phenylalanine carboxypeptidase domain-containing protein [Myxococcota bacterium]